MSIIAIAGATGTIGKLIVDRTQKIGHTVRPLSPSTGVDLLTGAGLVEALAGVDAIIDASQVCDPLAEDPITHITLATQNLLARAEAAGVKRAVMLSINGVQKPQLQTFPFYRARYSQENLFLGSSLSTTVVRSVQWFEFALNPAASVVTDTEVQVQNWAIQPVAMNSVATFLVEAAEGKHGEGIVTVAGSERLTLPQLTQRVLDAHGNNTRRVVVTEAVLPALADGSLYAPEEAVILKPALDDWLQ